MTTGAIPTDAPDAAAAGAGAPDLNDPNTRLPREDAMAAMVARRREMLTADGVELGAAAAAPTADESSNAPAADLAAQQAAETTAIADSGAQIATQRDDPPVLAGDDLGKYRVTKKVNGVETTVTVEDLLRDAQKIDAADAYLARAKQTVAEAVAVAEAAKKAAGAGVVNAPATPDTQAADPNQVNADEAIGEFVSALFQGDEATARAKLVAALNRSTGGQSAIDPDAIAASVEQRIAIKTRQDSVSSAIKSMLDTYPEVAGSKALRVQADEALEKLTGGKALTEFSPQQIEKLVLDAGKAAMDWFRPSTGGSSHELDPKAMSDRRAQKQGIDEPPRASGRQASSTPPPRTNSDTIAAMAAARLGQGRK